MNPIFAKLNYKAQAEIAVINLPVEFSPVVDEMRPLTTIVTDPQQIQKGEFAIAFVKTQQEVDTLSPVLADKLTGDAILWMTYPKGSSKKHKCDFNRDTGWTLLGQLGFEPVRMVAIDEDWSALRFRRVEYVKKMTRRESGALTEAGKTKTTQKGV
ncbi:hypothetical protein EXU85_05735 [Spirosoma sp. KCTC 42546]|uniref:hypothetical protein n=1 Tax=Spirosoma sp. KCTC 42546 TaxID=2520506 RepID=UPI00115C35A1|nr:hypothetical protein [Spirosoma sp. KCTC 42546]QDK78122.1 hypothetical protein EXU85_05735 [Spirosoma sp. KCTC 42546]